MISTSTNTHTHTQIREQREREIGIMGGGGFFVLMITVFVVGAWSQAPAPSPDCFDSLTSLSDCLTYVEVGSNLTKPDKGCCPGFAKLVDTSPVCLCQIIHNGTVVGVQIDTTKAINLPSACRVTTPSVSLCSALGLPVDVPVPSPGPTLPGSSNRPSRPSTPQTAPSPGGSSDASSTKDLAVMFLVALSTVAVAIF